MDFEFHHAQKEYVMLKRWLPIEEEDNTPNYAAQYLGCGGFVLNDRNQLLVVQEKYHTTPTWKLPGGHAEPGEYCWGYCMGPLFRLLHGVDISFIAWVMDISGVMYFITRLFGILQKWHKKCWIHLNCTKRCRIFINIDIQKQISNERTLKFRVNLTLEIYNFSKIASKVLYTLSNNMYHLFKLGEEISEAAEREVWEETGVHCKFENVICFRHQHNYKYGCSDFYFVSLMRPITEHIVKGDNEIALCKWMDVSVFDWFMSYDK